MCTSAPWRLGYPTHLVEMSVGNAGHMNVTLWSLGENHPKVLPSWSVV